MPFGKVPAIEIDGVKYGHSVAIINFLGKKLGLAGDNDLEALKLNTIALFLYDLFYGMKSEFENLFFFNNFFASDLDNIIYWMRRNLGENKDKELTKLVNEKLPYVFSKLEEIVSENGGHFLNGKFSWVDIYFFYNVEIVGRALIWDKFTKNADLLAKFPNLKKLYAKVGANPGIKKWIEARPLDPFFDLGKEMPFP